ncbi:carbonic anhydrase, partial [Mycolicibacterium conceptionense]
IVVCGHSSCGAMTAMLGKTDAGAKHLESWLAHGDPSITAFDEGNHPVAQSAAEAGFGTVDQLSMVNIAVQVQTLQSHPLARRVNVIGLFYDIASAGVLQVTPTQVKSLAGAA